MLRSTPEYPDRKSISAEVIFYTISDVQKMTHWSEATVQKLFNDPHFPAADFGKQKVDVSPEEYETCLTMQMGKNGEWVESYIDYPKYNGHRVYENVNMKLPYTGKLLLGAGFIHDYYIHMGYQRSWAYEELIELVFDNGLLVKCTDHSDIAKKQREYIDTMNNDSIFPDEREMEKFVTNSFSLDYKDKAWWLT